MPYIGNPIYQSAFVTDQFSGTGSQTAYTMSVAPAGTSNVLVAVSGVLQDPSTYGVSGNTLTFSTAPPSGTGNISCRYLGVPVTGVTTTAYRTVTEFTATASQTTFTPPSYSVGFINVYLNGVLLGSADYTASNGTTVVLATGASAGNLVTVESFQISSVANAIANAAGSVSSSNIQTSVTLTTPNLGTPSAINLANATGLLSSALPAGSVLQVANFQYPTYITTTSSTNVATGLTYNFTPTKNTSKVLLIISLEGMRSNTASTNNVIHTELYRNGSSLTYMNDIDGYNTAVQCNGSFTYLDSPASASVQTYTVYWRNPSGGGGTIAMNDYASGANRTISSMTLMEIAA